MLIWPSSVIPIILSLVELLLRVLIFVLELKSPCSRVEVLLSKRSYLGALPLNNCILCLHGLLELFYFGSQACHFIVSSASSLGTVRWLRTLARGTWDAPSLILIEDVPRAAVENGLLLVRDGGSRYGCSVGTEALHSDRRATGRSISTDTAVLLGAGTNSALLTNESLPLHAFLLLKFVFEEFDVLVPPIVPSQKQYDNIFLFFLI